MSRFLRLPTFPGLALIAVLVTVILLAVSQGAAPVHAATFTVANTDDSGAGSLRQAILDANGSGGADTINFDASVFPPAPATPATISPASPLPIISEDLTIDATGAGVIIDGSGAGPNSDGLDFDDGTFSLIGGGGLTIQNFTDDGVHIEASGDVTISGSSANDNDDDGFDVNTSGNVTISGSSADGNNDDGFDLDPGFNKTATVTNSTAENNEDAGFNIDTDGADGGVTISGSAAIDNTDEGFDIDVIGDITISDTTAAGSEDDDGFELDSDGNVSLVRVTAAGNFDDGIDIEHEDEFVTSATVQDSLIIGNGSEESGQGLDFDTSDFTAAGPATGNIICDNIIAGLDLDADVTVDATGNWWGDALGPDHPDNANQATTTGDVIFDGDVPLEGSGTVNFDPWTTAITSTVTVNPVTVGGSTTISFPWPGDPNRPASFDPTTNNGTLTSSINKANGTLEVILTPDTVGSATVTLTGPCDLSGSATVVVAAVAEVVQQPTPTATPGPTATATPTPTATATPPAPTPTATPPAATSTPGLTPTVLAVQQLPTTGGEPTGGTSALAWLALGIGALIVSAGGLALAYQRRRVR